jgi:hypothetical protein
MGEAMAGLQSIGGIGSAVMDKRKADLLAKEGAARIKESEQAQKLNAQKIAAGDLAAQQEADKTKLIAGTEAGGMLGPKAQEGTPNATGSAVDFGAVKMANKHDSDAKLYNLVHRNDPDFVPLSGGTFRRQVEAKALEANRADQAQIETKRLADVKEKEGAAKLSLETKDSETRRLAAESGRFSVVSVTDATGAPHVGTLNARTGEIKDSGFGAPPKGGLGNKQIVKPGEVLIPNLEPIPGVEITMDSLKKTKDGYAAYQAFKNQLDQYKAMVSKQGSELAGEKADRADAMVTDLGMKLKALQDLGVLNGRDWELMMKQIPATTGLGASLKGKAYAAAGQDAFGPRLDVLSNSMEDKFKVFSETNGFRKVGAPGGGSANPVAGAPQPGATKQNSHGDTIPRPGLGIGAMTIQIDPATGERIGSAPSRGASGSWGEPKKPDPTMTEALLPALSKARSGEKPGGILRQAAGLGSDVLSGALRIPAAAGRTVDTKMGLSGDHPQSFRESLDQINRGEDPTGEKNFITGATADPATLPSLAMGGPGLKAGIGLAGKALNAGRIALSGAKAGAVSAGLHQGDQMARTGAVNPGEAALEVGVNTALPLGMAGALRPIKGAVGGLKTILSKFSDIDPAALKAASNPEALAAAREITRKTGGDLSGMADNLGAKMAGMQADEAAAEAAVNARRQGTLQEGIQKARPWANNLEVSPYDVGKNIEGAAQGARKAAGERFQASQDAILEGQGLGRKGVQFGGVEGDQTPFEQTVDKYLADAGVGQGGRQYGVIGNVSIPAGAINEIRGLKETFKSGLTTRDMLDQLRLVDNRLNFGGDNGARLFASGSQEDLAMKGLRARLSDDLENQIARAAGKEQNTVLAAWHAHREAYHNTVGALEKIQDGIGAGTLNHEAYFNRIKNIGVDDLRKIAAEAKKNPGLAPTWNELRKGFFDNVIASGTKGDGVDFVAMKKTWDAMDDDLKQTMLPSKVISHVDGVLDRTAPFDFSGQRIADQNRFVGRDRQSTLSALENIGSKAKRTDLEDLRKLDDLLGLEGKDRFSEQASSFYLGKQLGMTGSRTGAKLAGAAIGGGIGGTLGTSQDGARGGGIGTSLGVIAVVALQSPAGALAAYKLLNEIRKGAVMTERNVTRPLANRGLTGGRLTRGVTTPLFGGRPEE